MIDPGEMTSLYDNLSLSASIKPEIAHMKNLCTIQATPIEEGMFPPADLHIAFHTIAAECLPSDTPYHRF